MMEHFDKLLNKAFVQGRTDNAKGLSPLFTQDTLNRYIEAITPEYDGGIDDIIVKMRGYIEGYESYTTCTAFQEVIAQLDSVQKKENKGRGIGCVETILLYMRAGDIDSARAVARNDSDKLWQYPDIRRFIHEMIEPIGYWDEESHSVVKLRI